MNHTHLSPFNNGMPLPRGYINKNDELRFFDVLQSQLGNHLLVQKGHESLKQNQRLKVHLTNCITQQVEHWKKKIFIRL